ncbi:MAG: hypothetical protein QF724_09080 [Planctomycetota bacterium]|jgi:hypothetical protein|nr:hypothetical protein [Planctomycetota bacterium]MDP6839075.1 hypothetical protein [Planctomycetota bacterium]
MSTLPFSRGTRTARPYHPAIEAGKSLAKQKPAQPDIVHLVARARELTSRNLRAELGQEAARIPVYAVGSACALCMFGSSWCGFTAKGAVSVPSKCPNRPSTRRFGALDEIPHRHPPTCGSCLPAGIHGDAIQLALANGHPADVMASRPDADCPSALGGPYAQRQTSPLPALPLAAELRRGTMRVFAAPVLVAQRAVGTISFRYGSAPSDPEVLWQLAEQNHLDYYDLAELVRGHPAPSAEHLKQARLLTSVLAQRLGKQFERLA